MADEQQHNDWQVVLHRHHGLVDNRYASYLASDHVFQNERSGSSEFRDHTRQSSASGGVALVRASVATSTESTVTTAIATKTLVLYSRSRALVKVMRDTFEDAAVPEPAVPSSASASASNSESQSSPLVADTETLLLDAVCPECACRFKVRMHKDPRSVPSSTAYSYANTQSGEIQEYFKILQLVLQNDAHQISDGVDASINDEEFVDAPTPSSSSKQLPRQQQPNSLSDSCFNQGYYDRFFVEIKKLGRGLRGSVFLVQHVLDTIYLGDYAVKSIPIGASHSWLVRQLQEVHLLEKLRHPNIIHYKHAWIENKQLTFFGPEVPCLFILMELANGGSLEDYIFVQHIPDLDDPPQSLTKEQRAHRLKMLRKKQQQSRLGASHLHAESNAARAFGGIGCDANGRRVRYLTTRQIWSLFLDICEGLAHLHRNEIIHRDLKPPNLLLQWKNKDDPNEIPHLLISDFGECEIINDKLTRAQDSPFNQNRTGATGTLEFMSPELLERDPTTGRYTQPHTLKGDMFSLGVVLYFLCYSSVPYSSSPEDVDALKLEIMASEGVRFPVGQGHERRVPVELQRLIERLMSRDPEVRPRVEDIVEYYRGSPPRFGDDDGASAGGSGGGSGGDGEAMPTKQRRGLSFTDHTD
ncbi:hypothetical protein CcCBS67573_g00037 [Chytriomyces confervae]|uniref:non-specific serine/threonine protein kinase n=1 Tax=Chytriomyces confervae TaxID=246404 RepID=A0A507FQV7_9FUNG|nr:hypothetical protein CcCBS67573_g00037 [Chytriomyces confervae]